MCLINDIEVQFYEATEAQVKGDLLLQDPVVVHMFVLITDNYFPHLDRSMRVKKFVSFSSSLASSNRASPTASSTVEKKYLKSEKKGKTTEGVVEGVVIGLGDSGRAIQLLGINVP